MKSPEKLPNFWRNLWKILAPSQRAIKALLIFIVISEVVNIINPYVLKMIIDRFQKFDPANLDQLFALVLLFLVASQLSSFFGYLTDKKIFKLLIDAEYYLPAQAHDKLMFLSLGYHEKENTGGRLVKIERGVAKIVDLLGNLSFEVVPTALQLIVTLVVLFFVNWTLALSLIFFTPWFIWVTYRANRVLNPIRKKRHKDYEIASGVMGQAIMNINAVQSFVQEKQEVGKFTKIKRMIQRNELGEYSRILSFVLTRNLIIDLGRVTIILLGIWLIYSQQITIGTFVFVFTLTEKAYFSLFRLSRFYDRLEEGREGVQRFFNLLNTESEVQNMSGALIPKNVQGQIKFTNALFVYSNSHRPAIRNINLTIDAGCVTALVGPSGGGKTTIARLIYRHYDPQAGSVSLDGVDLKKYDLYALRKIMAIVPQEVEIFDTSVRDNIAYANPKASLKEIQAAAKIANADEFINKLNQGYRTIVGERGLKLSGGQRQRLGIARAILANPKILIFDEATSNLDSQSERLIQEAMAKIAKNRTLILIAHRLSTIKMADKIVVLENGQVVESGNHYELADIRGGLYAKLIKLQSMGDVD